MSARSGVARERGAETSRRIIWKKLRSGPATHLAELIRTKQVSSVELTEMYLGG